MSATLLERLDGLHADLAPCAQRAGLALMGPVPALPLPAEAAAGDWALRALAALAEAACRRAETAARGGELSLSLGVLLCGGELRLWVLARDTLPAPAAAVQREAFAFLAGEGPPPAPDPLRLASLCRASGLAALDFLSADEGNQLWAERALAVPAGAVEAAPAGAPQPAWSRRPRLEREDLLRRLGGDQRIAAIVLSTFREEAPRQLAALTAALPARTGEAMRLAHALKGAARNVGALMVGELAAAIETALREERPARAAACLPRLEWEWARLAAAWPASAA